MDCQNVGLKIKILHFFSFLFKKFWLIIKTKGRYDNQKLYEKILQRESVLSKYDEKRSIVWKKIALRVVVTVRAVKFLGDVFSLAIRWPFATCCI